MIYPDKLIQIQNNLSIYIPDETQVQRIHQEMRREQKQHPFPFWAKIWPAAKAMSTFLQKEPTWINNKNVLEIGAGIGLPSFTITEKATSIIISDYSTDAVELIQKNINYLKIKNASAIFLDWNYFPLNLFAETILLSDVNYDSSQFDALNQLIQFLLNQGSTIIMATPQRIMAIPFVKMLQPNIREMYTQEVQHENQSLAISICILYQ